MKPIANTWPAGAAVLLATLWSVHALEQVTSVLLLIFAGVIFGVMLDAVTRSFERRLPGGHGVAYAATLALLLVVVLAVATLIGPRVSAEVPQLAERLPQAWDRLVARLEDYGVLQRALDKAQRPVEWLGDSQSLFDLISASIGAVFNLSVVMFVGVYAAAAPQRYLSIGRDLVSAETRRRVAGVAHELGHELRLWLVGRGLSMTLVGLATGITLFVLGVSLSFTLGLWAGLVSFVPYVGPLLGLVPALLIAGVQSPTLAGWVLLAFGVIQALESMILTPLIQQRTVALPPVVLISAQLVGGVLMGPLGVLLAAPLVLTGATTVRVMRQHTSGAQPADERAE